MAIFAAPTRAQPSYTRSARSPPLASRRSARRECRPLPRRSVACPYQARIRPAPRVVTRQAALLESLPRRDGAGGGTTSSRRLSTCMAGAQTHPASSLPSGATIAASCAHPPTDHAFARPWQVLHRRAHPRWPRSRPAPLEIGGRAVCSLRAARRLERDGARRMIAGRPVPAAVRAAAWAGRAEGVLGRTAQPLQCWDERPAAQTTIAQRPKRKQSSKRQSAPEQTKKRRSPSGQSRMAHLVQHGCKKPRPPPAEAPAAPVLSWTRVHVLSRTRHARVVGGAVLATRHSHRACTPIGIAMRRGVDNDWIDIRLYV